MALWEPRRLKRKSAERWKGQPPAKVPDPLPDNEFFFFTAKYSTHVELRAAMLCSKSLMSQRLAGRRVPIMLLALITEHFATVTAQAKHNGVGRIGRGHYL